jgi:hypothetical protein
MAQRPYRLLVVPALLTFGLVTAACGAGSPTSPSSRPLVLGAGSYSLLVYGTSTCLNLSGSVPSAANVPVTLTSTSSADVWRVSVAGNTLTGEVALVNATVQGWLRGSALGEPARLATGPTPADAFAFEGALDNDRFSGAILVGTPRFEGIGAASGAVTTCASNGFTLKRAS